MNITDVKVFTRDAEQLKAFANIVIDDAFIIKNIKVINGKEGLFVAMPSQKNKQGEYKDIAHPLNTETRTRIEQLILDKYNEVIAEENQAQE
ncbi:MAG TPA: septation regulator SpoVG [Candidatus Cloacimonadota bacterium]|jgi:stage V sporulation protein G|nr:septation regulator SpoVG [Candidatus Cloacimonadales bacterium]HOE90796.1 septation regulator SpoVG [Candidatus Cloacimonadota bacterium]HOQ80040.1 septation regulator SpoVG [Candidatus Cloacimonadota bacterium]HPK40083.1 septation regulator SpoVG [Candidatus Cloacimonadota bacterium]HPY96110.1 septation regulator SpoVG [Candidatus Cloacimonadota bacterium]